jgi:hypothetical protein
VDAFTEAIRRNERPMIGEEVIAIWDDGIDGAELYEVQKLVRCKDCKWYNGRYYFNEKSCFPKAPNADDFCSYGERKGE